MKVLLKNIGPITEVEFDTTKPLQVICGPNNTGKTYLTYCLYGLMKLRYRSFSPRLRAADLLIGNATKDIDVLDFYKNSRSVLKQILEGYFKDDLTSMFGIDAKLANTLFSNASITLTLPTPDQLKDAIENLEFEDEISWGNGSAKITKVKGRLAQIVSTINSHAISPDFPTRIAKNLLLNSIVKLLLPAPFISTVERNSIFTFSKELAIQRNELVDQLLEVRASKSRKTDPLFNMLDRRATRYPLGVRDGLEVAEDLSNYKKQFSQYAFFADRIEKELLNGKVSISKDGDLQFSPNGSKSTKLPIHLSASVVKSISSLVFYFRHFAQGGDCIIIDEPEMNLHPDAQIMVTRILSEIANSGFRIIISTHSDYIIREINNLVMLKELQSQNSTNIPDEYLEIDGLKYDMINAVVLYHKNARTRNKVSVKQVEINQDGFSVESMDEVTAKLNSLTQDLYFNLNELLSDD